MHPMLPTTAPAWVEPGTVSLFLFCAMLLARGRAGSRLLSRRLRQGKETLADVVADEFSDFLCDHPLLMLLLVSGSLNP